MSLIKFVLARLRIQDFQDNYFPREKLCCVIVGVQATAARMSQETVAAQDMLTRFAAWQQRAPESVAADTTYGNGEFLRWLADPRVNRPVPV